jgi:hypothetical protein
VWTSRSILKSISPVDKRREPKRRKQLGKQEWIRAIQYTSASGVTLPQSLIWKSGNLDSAWISNNTPPDLSFFTINKGWTSDRYGYE